MGKYAIALALLVTACGKDDGLRVTKVSEAEFHLKKLAKVLELEHSDKGAYPKGKAKMLPDVPTCCGGPNNKCAPSTEWAKDPIWGPLGFAIDEPTLNRFSYESTDGKTYTALALADADCDGQFVTYTLRGRADGTTEVEVPPKGQY